MGRPTNLLQETGPTSAPFDKQSQPSSLALEAAKFCDFSLLLIQPILGQLVAQHLEILERYVDCFRNVGTTGLGQFNVDNHQASIAVKVLAAGA